MLKRLKKYLIDRSRFKVYLIYNYASYCGKDKCIPPPLWDWDFIITSYLLSKCITLQKIIRYPYFKYLDYWAKKNHLDYIPELCEDNLKYLDLKHKKEYEYYQS